MKVNSSFNVITNQSKVKQRKWLLNLTKVSSKVAKTKR